MTRLKPYFCVWPGRLSARRRTKPCENIGSKCAAPLHAIVTCKQHAVFHSRVITFFIWTWRRSCWRLFTWILVYFLPVGCNWNVEHSSFCFVLVLFQHFILLELHIRGRFKTRIRVMHIINSSKNLSKTRNIYGQCMNVISVAKRSNCRFPQCRPPLYNDATKYRIVCGRYKISLWPPFVWCGQCYLLVLDTRRCLTRASDNCPLPYYVSLFAKLWERRAVVCTYFFLRDNECFYSLKDADLPSCGN